MDKDSRSDSVYYTGWQNRWTYSGMVYGLSPLIHKNTALGLLSEAHLSDGLVPEKA